MTFINYFSKFLVMSHGNLNEKAKNYCFELIRSTNIPVQLIIAQIWRWLFFSVLFGQKKKTCLRGNGFRFMTRADSILSLTEPQLLT